jgi:hypothetical protein
MVIRLLYLTMVQVFGWLAWLSRSDAKPCSKIESVSNKLQVSV